MRSTELWYLMIMNLTQDNFLGTACFPSVSDTVVISTVNPR